jgi:hypothetical protein
MNFEGATQLLHKHLIGNFYSNVSIGDVWGLCFDGVWLVAQSISANEESTLQETIEKTYAPAKSAVDKEYVSKAAIVASNMRREVTNVLIKSDCSLVLEFGNGYNLMLRTDTDIVDWQWCLSKKYGNPYDPECEPIVSCFWQDDLQAFNF